MPGNSILLCPCGEQNSYGWNAGEATPKSYKYFATSYGMNAHASGYYTYTPTVWHQNKITSIKKPTTNIWLTGSTSYWVTYYGAAYNAMIARHFNKLNVLFVDGHTGQLRKNDSGCGVTGIKLSLFY